MDSAAEVVQELAKTIVEGIHGDSYRVEGRVRADPGFNNASRNYLVKITNLDALRYAQEELYTTHDEVWDGFKAQCQTLLVGHEHWSLETFELYWEGGVLPQILRRIEQGYIALLVEAERLCIGGEWTDEAEILLTHHADRLGSIRRIGSPTKLQLLRRNYTYIRDSWRNKFTSAGLQQKQARSVRARLKDMANQILTLKSQRGNH